MSNYIVESGHAVPNTAREYQKYPFREMDVGDSFSFGVADLESVRSAAHAIGKSRGTKYRVVKGALRCWRIA